MEKIQHTCTEHRKKAKPNAFWKASSMFKPPFEGVPACLLVSLNNEERRAVEAHQLEFERKQLEAIRIGRQRIL